MNHAGSHLYSLLKFILLLNEQQLVVAVTAAAAVVVFIASVFVIALLRQVCRESETGDFWLMSLVLIINQSSTPEVSFKASDPKII